MASIQTSSYQGRYLKLTVVEESTSVTENTSTVRWTLESIGGSSNYYTIFNCKVVVNDNTVYNPGTVRWDTRTFPAATGSTTGTIKITHKTDGSADNVGFELHGKVYSSGDEDLSGELSLSKIPRQTSITSFTVSKRDETSFTFNWKTANTIDYAWYSTNNGTTWTGYDVTDGTSGSFVVSGLSANTSYNCKLKVRRKDSQLNTESSKITETTYNYPYVATVVTENMIIGNQQTLILYNPLSRNVTIKMHKNNTSGTQLYSGTTSGTAISFTPNANTLYSSIPNATSSSCVYSATYGSSTIATSASYSYAVKGTETPTFSNFTYQDTNATTTALTGNNQILVKGYSNVTATISTANKATANNSATMSSYKLAIGTATPVIKNYSSSAAVTLSINKVTSGTIVVSATDSRTLTTFITKNATFKNYSDLTIKSVTATRQNNGVGKAVTLTFNGTYWNNSFGSVTNSIKSISYQYRVKGSSTWISTGTTKLSVTTSGTNWSGSSLINGDLDAEGFNTANSYDIRLIVSDQLITKTYDVGITSGSPGIAIYKNKVAIGKKYDTSQSGYALQVGGTTCFDNLTYLIRGTGDTRYYAKRSDTNVMVSMGIGSGGVNHGLYSDTLSKWIVYADESNVYLNGNAATATNATNTTNTNITETNPTAWTEYYPTFANAVSGYKAQLANKGFIFYIQEGTTSQIGQSVLKLGNETAEGTAGNRRGRIRLCSKDAAHTDIYTNATSNRTINFPDEDGTIQCKPTNLYNNSSGATGTVTLSQTAANFNYIEIFFRNNDNRHSSVKIYRPGTGTNNIWLSAGLIYNDVKSVYMKTKEVVINGTSLTVTRGADLQGSFDYDEATNNVISILRVDGYK